MKTQTQLYTLSSKNMPMDRHIDPNTYEKKHQMSKQPKIHSGKMMENRNIHTHTHTELH